MSRARGPVGLAALLSSSLVGCGEAAHTDTEDPEPLSHRFTFAVVADPHITGDAERTDRLRGAVTYLEDEADARLLEVVFVVGDIGWSGGLPTARALLDELSVPYVPVLGDNEIQAGDEATFDEVFAPRYADLQSRFDSYRRTVSAVPNPEHGGESWFQNLSFTHRGVRFVGLDWCSRDLGTLYGEMADLHDFEGGTWPWFEAELDELPPSADESVVMLSHHPMHGSPGAFDGIELDAITGRTGPLADTIAANYAGHYHFDHEETVEEGGYDVLVTDATWDDVNRVRLVEVWSDGLRFEYRQELVDIP